MIAFGGVVVDHVDEHFQSCLVQALDHRLEFGDLLSAIAGGIASGRREVADRAIAPVIRQTFIEQELVVEEVVHRQQLDRRHAQ